MRDWLPPLTNSTLFLLVILLLSSLQVTLWFQSFGHFPPAHFWLPALVYWSLYRSVSMGLLMVYLCSLAISSLTALPIGFLITLNLCVLGFCQAIKTRIYWRGSTYFMMICALSATLFPIFHLILSWSLEDTPITQFDFFDWLMRPLWTALVALPLYSLFAWLDKVTLRDGGTENKVELV